MGCGQIHWFSIVNSCVTVLLLTGFLATILMRVLKADFIKYTRDDEAGVLSVYALWNNVCYTLVSTYRSGTNLPYHQVQQFDMPRLCAVEV